jgi:hypothetical protein
VVLAAALADSKYKKVSMSVALCTLIAITLPFVIKIRLHVHDANTVLLREETEKELDP